MSTSSVNPLSSLDGSLSTTSTGSTTSGTGLGQGIDVQQFVTFAVANQQAEITNLQTEETGLGSQNSEIATITSDLASLQTAATALNDPLGALGNAETATSSNPSNLTASASSTASAAVHTISIANLATTSSYYTDETAASNTPLAIGDTINIDVGGTQVATLTTSSSLDTLAQIAAAITPQTSALQASVITDATGSRLALVSATSGLPGDITVTGSLHLASSPTTAINFNQGAPGLNASLTVDGLPYSSTTNTVTGAINGVTLNLTAPTTSNNVDSPVTLTVGPDTSQATTAIDNFVSAYNTVVTEINNQFAVASDGTGGGVLENDPSLEAAQSALLAAASFSVTGNNGIVNLASIGVNLNNDGTLTVDNGALSTALSSNFSAVQNLFQNATTGFAQNLSTTINNISGPGNGILTLDAQSNTSQAQDLNQQITDLQQALTVQEAQLTTVYSNVNTTLQELPLLENQLNQQIASIA